MLFAKNALTIPTLINERNLIQILGVIFHWCWLLPLVSLSENPYLTYLALNLFQGTLGWQFLANHILKSWKEVGEFAEQNFFEKQIDACLNFKSSPWQDWYFIGINFHIEHHAINKIPRQYLRFMSGDFRYLCRKHNMEYDQDYFSYTLVRLVRHIHRIG